MCEEQDRLSSAPLLPSQLTIGEKEESPATEMATVDVTPAPAPVPPAAGRAPLVQQPSQDSTGGAKVNRELYLGAPGQGQGCILTVV